MRRSLRRCWWAVAGLSWALGVGWSSGQGVVGVEGAEPVEPAGGSSGVSEALAEEVRGVFRRAAPAVARIEAVDAHGPLAGTGFFVDPNGLLFTSYSIGGTSSGIVVELGERRYPASRLAADSRSGFALLKVEAETPFLPLGRSSELRAASPVVALGYGMDLPLSPTFGLVAGFERKYMGRFFSTAHIRANLPVRRGEGGAPLLNMRGEAVGVLISGIEDGAGCFALPIEAAEKVRRDYVRFGEVRPGWLGVDVEEAHLEGGGSAVQIKDLLPNAPAAASGLRRGDILLRVGEIDVRAPEDIFSAAFFLTEGDPVSLVVARGAERVTVEVLPGAYPSAGRPALQALAEPTPALERGMEGQGLLLPPE